MLRFVAWAAAATLCGALLWQTITAEPFWPRWVTAIALAAASGLVGLRISANSTASYIAELQRLNQHLVSQNHELEEANAMLLSQVSEAAEVSSEKA